MSEEIERRIARLRGEVERALARLIPASRGDGGLADAMRYSLLAGGKRLRPVLVLACSELFGPRPAGALRVACALECVHTYSLIHDDLPAMDDDDLRRGRPTSHKVFGEALAILAGDALLTLAFELMCAHPAALAEVARAAGWKGMVRGQAMDIYYERRKITPAVLRTLHSAKTAALMEASCVVGGRLAGASCPELVAIRRYGRSLGLAFQIVDDLLDVTGDEKLAGKRLRKDADKATYPALFGVEGARRRARSAVRRALAALADLRGNAALLRLLAHRVLQRDS